MMAACLVVGDSYIVWHISDLIRWFQDRGIFQGSGEAGHCPELLEALVCEHSPHNFLVHCECLTFSRRKRKNKMSQLSCSKSN
jgi:hypothetical protein